MKWVLLLLLACRKPDPPACPEPGETAADCPWAAIARHAETDAHEVLQAEAADIEAQLARDAKAPAMLAVWGAALDYNQQPDGTYGDKPIVALPIADELAALAGVAPHSGRIVHAGVQHTYGYLFSVLATPFGWKRARWVSPAINDGFGLPPGTIAPVPIAGTLLGNITWLAGSIAFANEPELAMAHSAPDLVSPAVQALDVAALHVKRLTETVVIGERTIELRTDFVELPHPGATATTLLVYSVRDSDARLVTAFPIDAAARDRYESAALGDHVPITTQYNAWVEGLTGTTVTGSRTAK